MATSPVAGDGGRTEKDVVSLEEILRAFGAPINEEQAWAMCYQCAKSLQDDWRRCRKECFQFTGGESVALRKDGSVGAVRTDTSGPARFESQLVYSLGLVVYRALDYGLSESEERELSHPLEDLIDRMTSNDNDDSQNHDEGIEDSDEEITSEDTVKTLERVVKLCASHLQNPSEAAGHYQAVCRALVAECQELTSFLAKISMGKEALREMADEIGDVDDEDLDQLQLAKEEWARLWMQVMKDLRSGVHLKKVVVEHNTGPMEWELTPYEILMDDIRSRRYVLRKVMPEEVNSWVDGEPPQVMEKLQKNAHDVILEFIRSRPPLSAAHVWRYLEAKNRQLKPPPPEEKTLHERIMDEIKELPKLKPVSRRNQLVKSQTRVKLPIPEIQVFFSNEQEEEEAEEGDENDGSPTPKKKILKAPDFKFNWDSEEDTDSEKENEDFSGYDDVNPKRRKEPDYDFDPDPDLPVPVDTVVRFTRTAGAWDWLRASFSDWVVSLLDAGFQTLEQICAYLFPGARRGLSKLLVAVKGLGTIRAQTQATAPSAYPDLPPDDELLLVLPGQTVDEVTDLMSPPSPQQRPRRNSLGSETPTQEIATQSHRVRFSGMMGNGHAYGGGGGPYYRYIDPEEEKHEAWKNPVQCLSLTIEEVMHIREVLVSAELENLQGRREIYLLLKKGKICFSCRSKRFSIFNWSYTCKFCKRCVCSHCCRKMRIPTEHFLRTPVYTLSPTTSPHSSPSNAVDQLKEDTLTSDFRVAADVEKSSVESNETGDIQHVQHVHLHSLQENSTERNNNTTGEVHVRVVLHVEEGSIESTGSAPSTPNASPSIAPKILRQPFMDKAPMMDICVDCKAFVCDIIRASKTTLAYHARRPLTRHQSMRRDKSAPPRAKFERNNQHRSSVKFDASQQQVSFEK
ncbi:protein spire homolog 1-like isoform X5 [Branchiostoma lanceolatum]|uniref:protein spire homolog 1-like isoform X5 n=1 Tax=Branchiostoma lanceolatum TaxID=7740 RepID=UPI003452983A